MRKRSLSEIPDLAEVRLLVNIKANAKSDPSAKVGVVPTAKCLFVFSPCFAFSSPSRSF